ncbi:MAG: superoxide dismutase, Cu-Zn family [Candidatus Binatota bacterium]|jgi:Cu-Zn family superoxide dismutase|nr:superoxide dismutase, Cu-Zn family [Candidatus Binatota bacterium]
MTRFTIPLAVAAVIPLLAARPAPAGLSIARTAVADIVGCEDDGIVGHAELAEVESRDGVKVVVVRVRATGLPDGRHGVHIHEVGTCEPCSAAGGHFDPGPAGNPSPDGNHPFHSGDLVNLKVKDGEGKMRTVTSRVTLSPGPLSIFDADGSAIIIHAGKDTFCPNGEKAGCAGGTRAACGVIVPTEE